MNKDTVRVQTPEKLSIPRSQGKIVDFSCGEEHSGYVDGRGNAHTWGYGQDGQLGHDQKESLTAPKKVDFEKKIKKIKCGGGHTGLLTEDGELYIMGRGRDG